MTTPGPEGSSLPGGHIEISDHAIVSVVHDAVLSCYGIVGMAPSSIRSAIGKHLDFGAMGRGIDIAVDDNTISIELSVVIEYGTPICTVAKNAMNTVKFRLESMLGMDASHVNINVDGLRMSDTAGGTT